MNRIFLLLFLLSVFQMTNGQMEGAVLSKIQGCGSATLIGNPLWGAGVIHPPTLYFEKQVGTNWVTIHTQVSVNGNNYLVITPGDITAATLYRLRARDENTSQEFISTGVIVDPGTWNGAPPSFGGTVSASAVWGSLSCGPEDDFLQVEPAFSPAGRPPYRIEYKKNTDASFTVAASEALWANIYGILPNTNYDVRVTDFCGRVATSSGFRLRVIAGAYVFQPTGCNDGIIRLEPSGTLATRGLPPFTYAIGKYTDTMTTIRPGLTFGNTFAFNNLSPGDYDVQLQDVCGNLSPLQTIRLGGGLPRLSAITSQLSPDSCSFTATVNVFTGTPPFQYGIKAPGASTYTYQPDNIFPGLSSAGQYSFKLKDKCGDSSLPVNYSVFSPPSISSIDIVPTGSSCINHFVVKTAVLNQLKPFDYGIRLAGSQDPFVFQASDTFKNMVAGNYDIVKRNKCGNLSPVQTVYTWTNSALCPVRTDPGDYEVASGQGCTDFSGNTWIDAKDDNGNLIFSINPQDNVLQQVCWGVRITGGDGTTVRSAQIQNSLLNFMDRNFYIQPAVTPVISKPVLIKLYITDNELQNMLTWLHNHGYPTATEKDLKILKKNGSAGSPVDLEVTNDNTAPSSQFTVITPVFTKFGFNWAMEFSLTSFSEFNPFAGTLQALPLDFISFTGTLQPNDVSLSWSTANAYGTSHFDIEWSRDGQLFTAIGSRPSINTPGVINDQFTHTSPDGGNNFYRIRQIDADGHSTLSKTIQVYVQHTAGIKVYPNPARKDIRISLQNNAANRIHYVQLTDGLGKLLLTKHAGNDNTIIVSLAGLPTGSYQLTVVTKTAVYNHKILKQ